MLDVVVVHFNPCGYTAPVENLRRFVHEMDQWQIRLHLLEATFPGQSPVFAGSRHIQATADNLLWQKERMINLVVESLPETVRKVAWIDADMMFVNRRWVGLTEALLDVYHVVQLFDDWFFEDENGCLKDHGVGCGKWGLRYLNNHGMKSGRGLPGGAWAARREVFPLADEHILGGSDGNCLDGWLGRWESFGIGQMTPFQKEYFRPWFDHAREVVNSNITNVPGSAVHYHHGKPKNRKYQTRNEILRDFQFDPVTHIEVDPNNGLWRWAENTPGEFREAVRAYFMGRQEDK